MFFGVDLSTREILLDFFDGLCWWCGLCGLCWSGWRIPPLVVNDRDLCDGARQEDKQCIQQIEYKIIVHINAAVL